MVGNTVGQEEGSGASRGRGGGEEGRRVRKRTVDAHRERNTEAMQETRVNRERTKGERGREEGRVS